MNPSKSLLLLGATSSLSEPIISLARECDWEVDATVRNLHRGTPSSVRQTFELDLTRKDSVERFLNDSSLPEYRGVISLLGATSSLMVCSEFTEISSYYETHCTNYFYVLEQLVFSRKAIQKDGHLLVLGSRASVYGSFDFHYAAAKGALVSFIRSLDRHADAPRSTCVAPSLITGSTMYSEMPEASRESHKTRSGNQLIDISYACRQIWEIFCGLPDLNTATFIEIGPSYF